MSGRKFYLVFIMAALLSGLVLAGCKGKGPKAAKDIEFSARMVVVEGGEKSGYFVNFTREKQRVEVVMDEHGAGTVIVRLDKGRVWTLMPAMKLYLESDVRPENKNPLIYEPDEILSWKRVGDETVDGHPTVKDKLLVQNVGDSKPMEFYRWFATDMGWPIRAEATDGSWRMLYKDIKVGRQDQSLFEPPRDFKMMARRPLTHGMNR